MTYPTLPPQLPGPVNREVAALRRLRRLVAALSVLLLLVAIVYAWPIVKSWIVEPRAEPRPITPRGELAPAEKSNIELFERVSPSVVYITTAQRRINPFTRRVSDVPAGTGSGFIWDEDGHIVTNFHVIRDASAATVVLNDQTPYPASPVGASPEYDLAVLRIRVPAGTRLRPIPLGDSTRLKVGQVVYAIGNPFGLDQTLTTGIISALKREITGVAGNPIEDVIQTDAAINPGNSGGPLLDSAGLLIGVNTAIYSPSGTNSGIGFAIPSDAANRVVPQIIGKGNYKRPRIGVQVDDQMNRQLKQARGLTGTTGLIVLAAEPQGPAARAGITGVRQGEGGEIFVGDILQKVNGRDINSVADLLGAMERARAGSPVRVQVWREGRIREFEITPE